MDTLLRNCMQPADTWRWHKNISKHYKMDTSNCHGMRERVCSGHWWPPWQWMCWKDIRSFLGLSVFTTPHTECPKSSKSEFHSLLNCKFCQNYLECSHQTCWDHFIEILFCLEFHNFVMPKLFGMQTHSDHVIRVFFCLEFHDFVKFAWTI
jgi:hypothetical protein